MVRREGTRRGSQKSVRRNLTLGRRESKIEFSQAFEGFMARAHALKHPSLNAANDQPSKDGVDQERIQRAVREILLAIGEDPDREGLHETPARVARMYAEMFRGLHDDPRAHLKKVFKEKYDE